jgi:Flp pilus assembly protein TadD
MRRAFWVFGLTIGFAGCAPTAQERARDYIEDGMQLCEKGAYADARESFQVALSLQPGDPDLLFNLGQCYDRLGQHAQAEPIYEQCLQRSPNHPECWHALCVLLVNTGRRAEAGRRVDEWMKQKPRLSSPYAEEGWLRGHDGDLPSARRRYQDALSLNPADQRALIELARLYETMGRPDRAYVLYERALEFKPRQPEIQKQLNRLRAQGVGRPRPE